MPKRRPGPKTKKAPAMPGQLKSEAEPTEPPPRPSTPPSASTSPPAPKKASPSKLEKERASEGAPKDGSKAEASSKAVLETPTKAAPSNGASESSEKPTEAPSTPASVARSEKPKTDSALKRWLQKSRLFHRSKGDGEDEPCSSGSASPPPSPVLASPKPLAKGQPKPTARKGVKEEADEAPEDSDKAVKDEPSEVAEDSGKEAKKEPKTSKKAGKAKPSSKKPSKAKDSPSLSARITSFFPVRRSSRKPVSVGKAEAAAALSEAVEAGDEAHLDVVDFGPKGRGVISQRAYERGDFVVEYKGELLSVPEAKERETRYADDPTKGCYMYFFKCGEGSHCVDATEESAYKGRLVNHSAKRPNLHTKSIMLKGEPRLLLVAKRSVKAGEELLYDYGDRDPATLKANPWLTST